jgi:hypothetical protein
MAIDRQPHAFRQTSNAFNHDVSHSSVNETAQARWRK